MAGDEKDEKGGEEGKEGEEGEGGEKKKTCGDHCEACIMATGSVYILIFGK